MENIFSTIQPFISNLDGSAGYGVSHNLDGTGWLEFDLPQPIDPNAVTYLKVDQTIIPLTAAE